MFIVLLRSWTRLKSMAGKFGRAWKAVAGFARRLVIYCCLAAAIVIDRILDCLERGEETK